MKLIPVLGAALLAARPCFAQSVPEQVAPERQMPPPVLNTVSADNQQAGQPSFTLPLDTCPGGAEQALRHQIETMTAGQPDYEAMAPSVANQWRIQIDKIGPSVSRQWGALVSLKRHPLHQGLFESRFEHARLRWEIACQSSYGKITGISFKTLS